MSLLSETKNDQAAGGLTPAATHTDPAAQLGTPAADESRALFARVRPPPGTVERLRWMRALLLPAIPLDEAEIDSAVREIQDAIRKAGKKPR